MATTVPRALAQRGCTQPTAERAQFSGRSSHGMAGLVAGAAAAGQRGRSARMPILTVGQGAKTSKLSANALSAPNAPPKVPSRMADMASGTAESDRISARNVLGEDVLLHEIGEGNNGNLRISSANGVTRSALETPAMGAVRSGTHTMASTSPKVPVYVMMPLDTVRLVQRDGKDRPMIMRPELIESRLRQLSQAGVVGVMVDVWWGIVECDTPCEYDWSAYEQLVAMIQGAGLKCQAVFSFHACGGNVGDTTAVTLPQWVLDAGKENPDIFYRDRRGVCNTECLSLGCDNVPVLAGRTPVQAYRDFARSFIRTMGPALGHTITEITVGLGPAGELRYPSYPEGDGRWRFPGVGEFQCYDRYMLDSLMENAQAAGHPEWGHAGPHDAGDYNSVPWETGFFNSDNGSFASEYGRFFLQWYAERLRVHADLVLGGIHEIMEDERVMRMEPITSGDGSAHIYSFVEVPIELGAKIPGVHWWYNARSHAAELTAGYYNTRDKNGYASICGILAKYRASLHFTCVEMRDVEHPPHGRCSPQSLLKQIRATCKAEGVSLAGENALQRYDESSFRRIEESAFGGGEGGRTVPEPGFVDADECGEEGAMRQVTFLRMGDPMWHNWDSFSGFIERMCRYRSASPESKHSLNCGTA